MKRQFMQTFLMVRMRVGRPVSARASSARGAEEQFWDVSGLGHRPGKPRSRALLGTRHSPYQAGSCVSRGEAPALRFRLSGLSRTPAFRRRRCSQGLSVWPPRLPPLPDGRSAFLSPFAIRRVPLAACGRDSHPPALSCSPLDPQPCPQGQFPEHSAVVPNKQ